MAIMENNQFITKLRNLGQSIWYDNLSRDILRSGKLQSYIEAGVSGLTSNPSIFKKAIADSEHYDADICELSSAGLSSEEICDELMLQDVAAAADMLRPFYEASSGLDGYASIEVSPLFAHDEAKTIEAANAIWRKLGRANIMIKVPATAAGIPAIERLLRSGINVNVTLIFSVENYEAVALAYLNALEDRMEKGQLLSNLSSVASLFVSRIDSIFEATVKKLNSGNKALQEQLGKVAIANSKLAYAKFLALFRSDRFDKLSKVGCRVQRPLWASTGVKNPDYSPLLYLESLVARDTVNTLPPKTLDHLLEGASIKERISDDIEKASLLIESLSGYGIDFPGLLQELQIEGVKLFADAYEELIQAVERKKESLMKA